MSSIRRTSTRPMSALSTFWDASPTMMTEVMPSGIFSIASGRSALGSINNAPSNPYMLTNISARLLSIATSNAVPVSIFSRCRACADKESNVVMPIHGFTIDNAIARAAARPILSPVNAPGPRVTAMPSRTIK